MADIGNSNPYSNYCGKSTYLKQVATIVFLAQIGSFVPASFARLGLVDKSELSCYDESSSRLVQRLKPSSLFGFYFSKFSLVFKRAKRLGKCKALSWSISLKSVTHFATQQ